MRGSAEKEQGQWLEGKGTTFAITPLFAKPGSSGLALPCGHCFGLASSGIAAPQVVLMGRLLQSPLLANPSTIFSCG